jgi:plasmid stability protein
MEEEARAILRAALNQETVPPKNLGTAVHELFRPHGGIELDIAPREPLREPPRFD